MALAVAGVILGHIQRGGSPVAGDRILASRLGVAAVDALLDGQRNIMVGIRDNRVVYIPFSSAIKGAKTISEEDYRVLNILSL